MTADPSVRLQDAALAIAEAQAARDRELMASLSARKTPAPPMARMLDRVRALANAGAEAGDERELRRAIAAAYHLSLRTRHGPAPAGLRLRRQHRRQIASASIARNRR